MRETNEIIRELREDSDARQADIAKILGISQQYYSRYEKGEFDVPLRHLISLARYYNVSLDYLTGHSTFAKPLNELEKNYSKGITVGQFLTKAMSLDTKGREEAINYMNYLANRN